MSISIKEYTYELPDERIAKFPLAQREQSKLLFFNGGKIQHHQFLDLPSLLPQHTHLYFNDTKVIPARLHFRKETGAVIEIFLLNPVAPSSMMVAVMESEKTCTWKCVIGNLKRWTDSLVLTTKINDQLTLSAELVSREENLVKLTWDEGVSFAEVIDKIGQTPLPPYLNREAEAIDKERYQTVYSKPEGAVAAPTAGLHFTSEVFTKLKDRGIALDFLTLHVSAGTFQPVKAVDAREHTMHNEQIIITRKNIESLLQPDQFVIPVGTTSMRTLESIYWYGYKLIQDINAAFVVEQNDPYKNTTDLPSKREALLNIINKMDLLGVDQLVGNTSIYILPGYTFRICNGLITNFHQPGSTLMLLVAALIGDQWKNVYQEALGNNYRFLSYGDSSLLIP